MISDNRIDKEEARDARGGRAIEDLVLDLRVAVGRLFDALPARS